MYAHMHVIFIGIGCILSLHVRGIPCTHMRFSQIWHPNPSTINFVATKYKNLLLHMHTYVYYVNKSCIESIYQSQVTI